MIKVKTLRNFAVGGVHYDAQKPAEFSDDIARQLIAMGKVEAVETKAAGKNKIMINVTGKKTAAEAVADESADD